MRLNNIGTRKVTDYNISICTRMISNAKVENLLKSKNNKKFIVDIKFRIDFIIFNVY